MTAGTHTFGDFERELRRGLIGLPRPDVDDLVDEMRSHVAERIRAGAGDAEALDALGDPAAVAAEMIARRFEGDSSREIRPAGRVRTTLAWIADFIVGWGPTLLSPIWLVLLGVFVDRVLMSPGQIAEMSAEFGYTRASVHPSLTALTLAFVAWGVYYWRVLRARSVSIGMRMAGISRIVTDGRSLVVVTSELAESEPARIVSRSKWYLGAPVGMLGLILVAAVLYFAVMVVGSVMQPWDFVAEATQTAQDSERAVPLIEAFYAEVIAGDTEAAQALADKNIAGDVERLVERLRRDEVGRVEVGSSIGPEEYLVNEYPADGTPSTVAITVDRFEQEAEPGIFVTAYRVTNIDPDPEALD